MTDDAPVYIFVAPDLAATPPSTGSGQVPALPPPPLDQNPAAIYLASLSEGSRPTMRTALNTIAALLGAAERRNERDQDVRYFDVPWATLRSHVRDDHRGEAARQRVVELVHVPYVSRETGSA